MLHSTKGPHQIIQLLVGEGANVAKQGLVVLHHDISGANKKRNQSRYVQLQVVHAIAITKLKTKNYACSKRSTFQTRIKYAPPFSIHTLHCQHTAHNEPYIPRWNAYM